MKKIFIVACISVLYSGLVLAGKPEWAGEGKPTVEQKKPHYDAIEDKGSVDNDIEDKRDKKAKKIKEEKEKLKGMEKQKEKKTEQVMTEADKGSEKGKEARETRKKWWKFWGE